MLLALAVLLTMWFIATWLLGLIALVIYSGRWRMPVVTTYFAFTALSLIFMVRI